MDKEFRNIKSEIRASDEGGTITGYCIRFNEESRDMGFIETIEKGAVNQQVIDSSDVFCLFNHEDDKVLGRSLHNQGNLKLSVDDQGVKYECRLLDNELAKTVKSYIDAGLVNTSSFAFSIDSDDENAQEWKRMPDGTITRTIRKIARLYDASPVWSAAYATTSCSCRAFDEFKAKEEKELEEERETPTVEEPQDETPTEDETPTVEEPIVEPQKEEPQEETHTDETPTDEPQREESKDENRNLENNNKVITNNSMTEKRYSLISELKRALESGKPFNLNDVESRAYTVTAEGDDVVQTDIYDIWEPLRAKNVLVQAGAKTITGIKNNVQIPLMSAVTAGWAGETAAATDGSATFTSKKLSPKRITAKYPISLQLLAQDSIGIEAAIRADIQKAINSKLEATLLGNAAGTDDQPAGLFHAPETASTVVDIATFADICNLEGSVEEANFESGKYIISPKAKAALRNMAKSAKSTQLVMEGGQIDGTEALVTSHVADKKMVYGDFSNLVIATWDNVQIDVVRDTASVGNGMVTIVVNAYCDAALVRPEALVFAKIKE